MKDLAQLRFRDLQLLRALYRQRSLSGAAAEVGLPTPSASRILAQLRTFFGDQLFVRYAAYMMPTPAMVSLLPKIDSVLRQAEALQSAAAFSPHRYIGVARVGCLDYDMLSRMVMRTAERWAKESPHAAFELRLLDESTGPKLASGELDVAVWYKNELGPNIHSIVLQRMHPTVVVSKAHPLAAMQAELTANECLPANLLCQYPRIDAAFRRLSAPHYFPFELEQRVVFSVPLFGMALRLLTTGDYTLALPKIYGHDLLDRLGVVALRIDQEPFESALATQYLLWHDRSHRDPAHQWLRSLFADEARKLAEEEDSKKSDLPAQ